MSEDITSGSLPNSDSEAGGNEAASHGDTPWFKTVGNALGKDFPSEESALKSIKDTFKNVGSVGRQAQAKLESIKEALGVDSDLEVIQKLEALGSRGKVDEDLANLKAWKDEQEFYSEHTDLKPYASLLNELRGSTGKSLAEVAESEAFKGVIEKAKAHDETQNVKSVLTSNPRLGRVRDKIQDARKLQADGDHEAAVRAAVGAVIDLSNES